MIVLILLGLCSCGPDFDAYKFEDIFDYPLDPTSEYMIIVGDVQEYTYYDKYAPYFMKSMNWIRGMYKRGYKIDCVLQTGDLTNTNEDWEYRVFRDYTKYLSEEVLFIPVTGNHDYTWRDVNKIYDRKSSLFNEYASFPKTKENVVAYYEQNRIENIIVRNQIKGHDVYIIALEFAPRPEVIDWAKQYVEQNQDKLFILLTHEFLSGFGVRETNDKYTSARNQFEDRPNSTPEEVWQNLVYPNDNIRAVICGHNIFSCVSYSTNQNGRRIPQMLFNLQYLKNGGNGALLLWEIPNNSDSIDVKVINTIQNKVMEENDHKPMCENEALHYKISIF